jgi:hypothetical protein
LEAPDPCNRDVGNQGPAGQVGEEHEVGSEDDTQPIPVIGDAVPAAPAVAVPAPAVAPPAVAAGQLAAAVVAPPAMIPPPAGFVNPAFGLPPVPVANAIHAGEMFVQATAAVGMILHPWVAQLAREGNLPLFDVNSGGTALQHRIEFTRHRDEVLGPISPQCCKYQDSVE